MICLSNPVVSALLNAYKISEQMEAIPLQVTQWPYAKLGAVWWGWVLLAEFLCGR